MWCDDDVASTSHQCHIDGAMMTRTSPSDINADRSPRTRRTRRRRPSRSCRQEREVTTEAGGPPSFITTLRWILPFLMISMVSVTSSEAMKYNQRTFLNVKAINFVDPTKHGFRLMLRDEFVRQHLAPILLPTLYVTAIPLRADEPTLSRVFYPENVQEEKQVNVVDLRERSWYFVCIEWENFNRHNETTGTDCRMYRTLDRYGKGVDTTLDAVEPTDVSSQMFMFRFHTTADFPIRITASLQADPVVAPPPPPPPPPPRAAAASDNLILDEDDAGGVGALPQPQKAAAPSAQVFHTSAPVDLDVVFPFLRHQQDYGRLCILEEPLVTGYTTMGRLVAGVHLNKCYFSNLKTKDYELSIMDSEASPYRRTNGAPSARSPGRGSTVAMVILLPSLLLLLQHAMTHFNKLIFQ